MSGLIRVVDAKGQLQNRHGAPAETIQRMAERWELLLMPM